MRVKEAKESYPINAMGGLYILLEGSRSEIYSEKADRFAVQIANEKGWNGNGKGSVGIPSREGVTLYSRAYWFYEKK